jgi:gliding motility-associated-like protein
VPAGDFYDFIGWQSVNGGTFTPNADLKNVTLQIYSEDTIIAQFVELPNYPITVRVSPEGSGFVMLDWQLLPNLPWTGNVLGMNQTDFKAVPKNEWEFSHWSATYHVPVPSDKSEEMQINVAVPDEIIAHFIPREYAFYIPNSFTPNEDGVNDIFRPKGNEWDPAHFHMQIFNRNGNLVFETRDVEEGWNGAEAGGVYYTQPEVYVYQIEVKNAISEEINVYRGHITVIR